MRREWRKINTAQHFMLWFVRNYGERQGHKAFYYSGIYNFARCATETYKIEFIGKAFKRALIAIKATVKFYKDKNDPYVNIQEYQDAIALYYEFQPALSSFLQRHINRQKKSKYFIDPIIQNDLSWPTSMSGQFLQNTFQCIQLSE